jgi:hypothetical protein
MAGTYVLARIDDDPRDPPVVFDHVCAQGLHVVWTLRDTLVLRADGTASRGLVMEWLENGVPVPSLEFRHRADGPWGRYTGGAGAYYARGPSVWARLWPVTAPSAPPYTLYFRLLAPDTLGHLSRVGGSCGSDPHDGRTAEFRYVRR